MADRLYPVVVEFTEHRLVLVDADSLDDAVAQVRDGDMSEDWQGAEQLEVLDGVVLSDGWTAHDMIESWRNSRGEIGPVERCPDCGVVASTADWLGLRYARHSGACSRHIHHVDRLAPQVRDEDGRPGDWVRDAWWLTCSCDGPDLIQRSLIDRPCVGDPGAPRLLDHDAFVAAARAHVEGRPHSPRKPWGIDGAEHPDPRSALVPAGGGDRG